MTQPGGRFLIATAFFIFFMGVSLTMWMADCPNWSCVP